ncbi:MAG: DUF2334 domain-containing protein [Patescibacteria group bacterium]|nr:DUF2334 domain-containing protein [Patescibacteria group bacterium]
MRRKIILRNDDVSVDTDIEEIKRFCEVCDRCGFRILQCITPLGRTHEIDVRMSNEEIKKLKGRFLDNGELVNFLKSRNDLIAIHGLWHTHEPSEDEAEEAKKILKEFYPTYFVPPFNEGEYGKEFCGLKVSQKTQRLEDYLDKGTPTDEIVYLHSWRFGNWYPFNKLEKCLKRITMS